MKNTILLIVFLASFFILDSARGQGALTPPGPPSPTMKSLSQIEPRTAIASSTTITAPGSYYLTGNLAISSGNAITIAANNVALDLNGFTISSTASPAGGTGSYGIYGNLVNGCYGAGATAIFFSNKYNTP